MIRKLLFSCICVLAFTVVVQQAYAQDLTISISSNGEGSDNQVNASIQATTTVNQSNTTQDDSIVNSDSDSGKNINSNNLSDSSIHSGGVGTSTMVQNNLNKNVNGNDCNCHLNTAINDDGNGKESNNVIALKENSSNIKMQTASADIVNNIFQNDNSGKNTLEGNQEGAIITTGEVKSSVVVENSANNNLETRSNSAVVDTNPSPSVAADSIKDTPQIIDVGAVSVISNSNTTNNFFNNEFSNNNSDDQTPVASPQQQPIAPAPQASGAFGGTSLISGFSQGFSAAISPLALHTNSNLTFISTIIAFVILFAGFGLRLYSGSSPPLYNFYVN